jgi:agmatine/peptidylarginine deiminase
LVLACHSRQAPSSATRRSGDAVDDTLTWPDLVAEASSSPAVAATERLRLPGEFEPVERLILVWDDYFSDFLFDIVSAAWSQAEITIVVDTERPSLELERMALDPRWVRVVRMPVGSIWIRDFGPLVVRGGAGERHLVRFDYVSGGQEKQVADRLSGELWNDWPRHRIPIAFEGGNLQVDGTGRCITTAGYDDEELMSTIDVDALRVELRDKLGCDALYIVPPLMGEPTTHVDMFATITGPGEIIVGRYHPDRDPINAARLDLAAKILQEGGFLVHRIPMPANSDGFFRSYTNALAVNGVVLVPVYPEDTAGEAEALEVFGAAYPGRTVLPVDASTVIQLDGAIHCATLSVAASTITAAQGVPAQPRL